MVKWFIITELSTGEIGVSPPHNTLNEIRDMFDFGLRRLADQLYEVKGKRGLVTIGTRRGFNQSDINLSSLK